MINVYEKKLKIYRNWRDFYSKSNALEIEQSEFNKINKIAKKEGPETPNKLTEDRFDKNHSAPGTQAITGPGGHEREKNPRAENPAPRLL